MSKIELIPCMVFDVICFINYDIERSVYMRLCQKAFKEKIDKLTSEKLNNGYLTMSDLCGRLASYAKNGKVENYTLDDLANFFKKSDIYEALLEGYIWRSSDKYSPEEWIEKYLYYIDVLKEIKFDKLWESDLLPVIQESINKRQEMFKNDDFNGVFKDIQKLKRCEPIENVKIFISGTSCPTAFRLYDNCFLDHFGYNSTTRDEIISNIYHELMHGFTNDELNNLYFEYINSIDYLKKQWDILVFEFGSGPEEEFTCAAEYYLRMKNNGENKIELLKEARSKCNGCMPTSVFLFDLLSKEAETPDGYVKWLFDVFKNKRLPQDAIEYNLDRISSWLCNK